MEKPPNENSPHFYEKMLSCNSPSLSYNLIGIHMQKIKKIFSALLIGVICLTTIHLHAKDSSPTSSPIICSSLLGKQWVEKCIEKYPEILWLADENVRKTEEGNASSQDSYSTQLFDQKYVEFDRTLMTIECLKLILEGSPSSYQKFTAAQPKDMTLSPESFQTLHAQGQQLLQSNWKGLSKNQIAEAMETALVLGDIGKSAQARKLFKPYGIEAPDHDDFHGEIMLILEKQPELSPSFARLSLPAKQLLVKTANLAHYGHITHLEGATDMFRGLCQSTLPYNDPIALSFDLFIHTCDVAGALGHVNPQSSLVYTEPTHRAMQTMNKAVQLLSNPHKTEWDAYQAYLTTRATWLGLDPHNPEDRVLTRIGAMLRLFTPQEGTTLRQALMALDESSRNRIIAELDVKKEFPLTRTPTYIPALLINLSNNSQLGNSKEERLSQAITLGLPFISRVLKSHKDLVDSQQISADIPLNFNEMAGIAKTSPELLTQDFSIDKEGDVHPACK